MSTTLFRNLALFTPVDGGCPARGARQNQLHVVQDGALLVRDGQILAAGARRDIERAAFSDETCDLNGRCVIPGFVDPHTHLCFAARRENEFRMRLEGRTYLEILAQGGGILSSVRAVMEASDEALLATTRANATSALCHGTTTLEVKSGYGLDLDTELRMLRVIKRLGETMPLDVAPTFMGAHAVPPRYKEHPDDYVRELIEVMLPAVANANLARFCDVFCEKGVFSVAQSRAILLAAKQLGFALKVHADEVHDLGGAMLAAEVGAISAEHLLAAADEGLAAMGKAGTVAVLLPATAYSLRKPYARGRAIIAMETPVALATDCNPGSCFCESMPFVMGLAIMAMDLTPEEALTACTLNAAYAIGMADRVGSLEVGKQADFLVLDCESPAGVAYHAGANPVVAVYKRGVNVAREGRMLQAPFPPERSYVL